MLLKIFLRFCIVCFNFHSYTVEFVWYEGKVEGRIGVRRLVEGFQYRWLLVGGKSGGNGVGEAFQIP